MARPTADELRTLKARGKVSGVVDALLDEMSRAAAAGENEYSISPMHPFYHSLSTGEKAQLKGQFEALGYTTETRTIPNTNTTYLVVKW